jgi:hypothetical protein
VGSEAFTAVNMKAMAAIASRWHGGCEMLRNIDIIYKTTRHYNVE